MARSRPKTSLRANSVLFTGGEALTTEQMRCHYIPLHCFQIEVDAHLGPMYDNYEVDYNKNGIFSVNHSCEPNCGIRNACGLVALRDIKDGEEITYDYCMTDYTPGFLTVTMDCLLLP